MGARIINAGLGLWLFFSGFLWAQPLDRRMTAWIFGMVVVTAALIGFAGLKLGRYVNATVGAWLILSAILRRGLGAATFWNYLLVGAALVLFSMASSLGALRQRQADV